MEYIIIHCVLSGGRDIIWNLCTCAGLRVASGQFHEKDGLMRQAGPHAFVRSPDSDLDILGFYLDSGLERGAL